MSEILTMTDVEFQSSYVETLGRLVEGRIECVHITISGRVVAIVAPPVTAEDQIRGWLGSMRDMTFVPKDFDLTEPILQDIPNAELGILHE